MKKHKDLLAVLKSNHMRITPARRLLLQFILDNKSRQLSLKEIHDYGVRTACNGEEALALLKVLDTPCLILTDLMMPVMNGYEFIQLASQTHTIATIPIVIVSATPKESDLKVMSESGKIKGLIKKPFDCDYLMKVVVEHCGPPPSSHLQGIAGVLSTPISASR